MTNFQTLTMDEKRQTLLREALGDIAFDGWVLSALYPAEQRLGLDSGTADRLFDFDPHTMAVVFADMINADMLDRLASCDIPDSMTRRIALALKTRLQVMTPHRECVRGLVKMMASSKNGLGTGVQIHAHTAWGACDTIWNWAGDKSVKGGAQKGAKDYNKYTKRGLLMGVYTTTVLYWLSDESENYTDTHNFIDRQLEGVVAGGRAVGRIKGQATGWIKKGINTLKKSKP